MTTSINSNKTATKRRKIRIPVTVAELLEHNQKGIRGGLVIGFGSGWAEARRVIDDIHEYADNPALLRAVDAVLDILDSEEADHKTLYCEHIKDRLDGCIAD